MNNTKTWFVTGTSQGIGLELVKKVLAAGDNVVAASRSNMSSILDLEADKGRFLPIQMDLKNEESIVKGVLKAIEKFGRIDVLVNNAGYGLLGGIEESSKEEVQDNFDVNVFGLLSVTRAVLPFMRKANSGHIFNISSVFGLIAGAGWGIYCATKFAVEGLSEALAQEVQPFGIQVTIIEPGYFRTNFLNAGSVILPKQIVEAYTEITEIKRKHAHEIPGSQPGDPEKAAEVIFNTALLAKPPLRLLLGSDAVQYANYKISMLQAEMKEYEAVSISTDFPQ
ncbi:oxidoreductase [Pedobacter fastidiosus]|uniref:SDR family NAD(P)-dependent oxidoreductase n=1 Tax=Pedobacter fastidiosus TaxID=2765361 RepID=A0ABR7KS71_9SPHI|nr:oxidoreductase [Pedobacter fastidiosus]MBC6110912.1 SDR family NAD(P)-dependent oxidoreductase [Pedobacter fastidiosus]